MVTLVLITASTMRKFSFCSSVMNCSQSLSVDVQAFCDLRIQAARCPNQQLLFEAKQLSRFDQWSASGQGHPDNFSSQT